MAIDTSIYQNAAFKPAQMPNLMDAAQGALNLSDLSMRNKQMQLQMQTQQAMRDAYAKNTGPDGKLNQQGFLSDLGRADPQAAMQYQQQFAQMGKEAAEAQSAKMEALNKTVTQTLPSMQYLAGLPEPDRAKAFPEIMKQLAAQGVQMHNIPQDSQGNFLYDKDHFQQGFGQLKQTAQYLANEKTKAEIGSVPAQHNAVLYGSRSPNAEITSQYDKQAGPIRSSQMAMQQMLDNYNYPSPQGDASLILNAFKIKFPNAPDVNSLEELSKSQAASDRWKQMAAHALAGGLDQSTRDNLIRDGVSTFRANVDSLRGVQERYQARAKQANVSDPTLTFEPAIEKTYASAMDLSNKIGPYVPPSERGGIKGELSKIASKVLGISGNQPASAGERQALPAAPEGSIWMRAPNGKIKAIPKSQKGEAIAAGGSVVQ